MFGPAARTLRARLVREEGRQCSYVVRHGWLNMVECEFSRWLFSTSIVLLSISIHLVTRSCCLVEAAVISGQLAFVGELVLSVPGAHDNRSVLSLVAGILAVAAAHELLVVAVGFELEQGDRVAFLSEVAAANAQLARDNALNVLRTACLNALEEARVLRLLRGDGLLQVEQVVVLCIRVITR